MSWQYLIPISSFIIIIVCVHAYTFSIIQQSRVLHYVIDAFMHIKYKRIAVLKIGNNHKKAKLDEAMIYITKLGFKCIEISTKEIVFIYKNGKSFSAKKIFPKQAIEKYRMNDIHIKFE